MDSNKLNPGNSAPSTLRHRTCWQDLHYWRYLLIRTISCPMPFLSNQVPYVGGRTIIEVLLAAFATLVCIAVSLDNYEGTGGSVLDHLILITVLFGLRTNVLNIVFGISYERALMAHKFFGVLILVVMGIHMQAGFNSTGIILLICLVVLPLSYLIKKTNFEIFYYAHIIAYLVIVPVGWMHGGYLCSIAVAFYALDLAIRFFIRGRKVSAEVEKLPGDVTMVSFKKCFEYEPGQFVFIRIPSLSVHEYHPFSICSSPLEDRVTLHIRNLGDWTGRLMQMAANNSNLHLDIHVEGPYGTTAVDITHEDYQVVLLISGGIGVAPLQGIYNHFILEHEAGRRFRKVIFVWSVRDKVIIEVDKTRLKPAAQKQQVRDTVGMMVDVVDDVPPSFQPSKVYSSTRLSEIGAPSQSITRVTEVEYKPSKRNSAVQESDMQNLRSPYVFHSEFYLTKARSRQSVVEAGLGDDKHVHFGRPDLPELFKRVTALCTAEGLKRVAVCVCGPASMVNEVDDLCRQSKLSPERTAVRFDCHKELFDF